MATTAERNAAFDAVKPHVMALIPSWAHSYVNDKMILQLVDAALMGAEKARQAQPPKT